MNNAFVSVIKVIKILIYLHPVSGSTILTTVQHTDIAHYCLLYKYCLICTCSYYCTIFVRRFHLYWQLYSCQWFFLSNLYCLMADSVGMSIIRVQYMNEINVYLFEIHPRIYLWVYTRKLNTIENHWSLNVKKNFFFK